MCLLLDDFLFVCLGKAALGIVLQNQLQLASGSQ